MGCDEWAHPLQPDVRGYATQIAQTLRGKIASLFAENSYFAGRLARVQDELDSQRDTGFHDLSKENRALKEEVEKLQGLQQKLVEANAKVAERTKQLEKLPKAEQDRDETHRQAKESEEEEERLRARVEQLTKANADEEVPCGMASAEGFQRAVDLIAALAPWVNFHFFTEKYYAREKKIWLGDEMVFDPAEHQEPEDDEEESPKDDAGDEGEKPKDDAGGEEEIPKQTAEGGNA